MIVFRDQKGLVHVLNERPLSLARLTEELGGDAVQLPHFHGTISPEYVYELMIMIVHEAAGMANPVAARHDVLHGIEDVLLVLVTLGYCLFPVAARGPVMNCAGIFFVRVSLSKAKTYVPLLRETWSASVRPHEKPLSDMPSRSHRE
jgi:hypothetical protein